jgi:hypothetical protein
MRSRSDDLRGFWLALTAAGTVGANAVLSLVAD